MPLHPRTCLTVTCDACHTPLTNGACVPHFDSPGEAHDAARAGRWVVLTDGRMICPTGDTDHQVALDTLMRSEPAPMPMPDGQLTFGVDERTER